MYFVSSAGLGCSTTLPSAGLGVAHLIDDRMQKPKLHGPENIQLDGLTDFVGAVTNGLHGAVAFDFIVPHDRVEA